MESAMLKGTYNDYDTNWPIKAPDEAILNAEPAATDKKKNILIPSETNLKF